MRVRVKVPATTANMGPGFDCLGMALALYNEVEYEVGVFGDVGERRVPGTLPEPYRDGNTKVCVLYGGEPYAAVPVHKNLAYSAFSRTLRHLGVEPSDIIMRVLRTEIPIARGLGSSAACIAAGVLAAREIAADLGAGRMSFEEAVDLAVDMEGHPDNVVPAMVGGMTAAARVGETTVYRKISVPNSLTFAAIIPDFRLSTEEARAALPATYSRADTVFNISRAALLIAGLASGDLTSLRDIVDDKVHQPYRLSLIPHSAEVIEAAMASGSEAEFVSGSGPTIMAVITGDGTRFAETVSARLSGIPGGWTVRLLSPDRAGAQVTVQS